MEENPSTRNQCRLARPLRLVKHFLKDRPRRREIMEMVVPPGAHRKGQHRGRGGLPPKGFGTGPAVPPGQGRKAHPEPLPSLHDRSDPQAFHHSAAQRPAPLFTINAAITPWRDAFADLSASGGADLAARRGVTGGGRRIYSVTTSHREEPAPRGLSASRP
jgi:hypothetical protein